MRGVKTTKLWHLKDIQDAIAYSVIANSTNKKIGEIGAGDFRILQELANNNNCYVIDDYEGAGNGPTDVPTRKNIAVIKAKLGEHSNLIESNYFDVVFSVSVIEHVPFSNLKSLFKDCHRILKTGGMMIHLIDIYIDELPEENSFVFKKIKEYESVFISGLFKPAGEIVTLAKPEDISFSCSFATNPDNAMMAWNKMSPDLRQKRERSQSCSLVMIGSK